MWDYSHAMSLKKITQSGGGKGGMGELGSQTEHERFLDNVLFDYCYHNAPLVSPQQYAKYREHMSSYDPRQMTTYYNAYRAPHYDQQITRVMICDHCADSCVLLDPRRALICACCGSHDVTLYPYKVCQMEPWCVGERSSPIPPPPPLRK
jgi:hypothetical protein